jgi:hypothetical protein
MQRKYCSCYGSTTVREFVTGIKCTIFSEAELETLERRAGRVAASVDIHKTSTPLSDYEQLGFTNTSTNPSRWRLRKAIEQSLASAIRLGTPWLEACQTAGLLAAA